MVSLYGWTRDGLWNMYSIDWLYCTYLFICIGLISKERKKKKPTAWKVDLQVGPEITISVAGFIQVRREAPKSWKKCMASDSEANELRADVSYVKNTEDMEIVEKEDLIESYKYGSQIIPVNGKSLLLHNI